MDPVTHTALRLLLTAILIVSITSKLREYEHFLEIVAQYKLLPNALTGVAGATIMWWEAAALVGLWSWPSVGATLAAALFGIYALAILANLLRGRAHIDCGCHWGGRDRTTSLTPWLPIRNGALVIAALALFGPVVQRPLTAVDVGLIGVVAVFLVAVFFVMDRAMTQLFALSRAFAAFRRPTDA